jgi:hypothetical protein
MAITKMRFFTRIRRKYRTRRRSAASNTIWPPRTPRANAQARAHMAIGGQAVVAASAPNRIAAAWNELYHRNALIFRPAADAAVRPWRKCIGSLAAKCRRN